MKSTQSMQKGFTLIELMIVVAIIGILSAIAIPQYQNYIARTQVSRVMSEAGSLKTSVETCILDGKTTLGTNADQCQLGATTSNLLNTTTNPAQADGSPAGTPKVTMNLPAAGQAGGATADIESTFGNKAASALSNKKLTWHRDDNGSWSCYTDVDSKFRPSGCTASSETTASNPTHS